MFLFIDWGLPMPYCKIGPMSLLEEVLFVITRLDLWMLPHVLLSDHDTLRNAPQVLVEGICINIKKSQVFQNFEWLHETEFQVYGPHRNHLVLIRFPGE